MLSRMFSSIFRRLDSNRNGFIVGHVFRVSRRQLFASIFGSVDYLRPPPLGFFTVSAPETMVVSLGPYQPELRLHAVHARR